MSTEPSVGPWVHTRLSPSADLKLVRLRSPSRNYLHHLFQSVGENEIVEINRVDRRTVRASMNARLAEINRLGSSGQWMCIAD